MPTLACANCGFPYEAYPPDDLYVVDSSDECVYCARGTKMSKKQRYECSNCHTQNFLYWHAQVAHRLVEMSKIKADIQDEEKRRRETRRLFGYRPA